MSRITSEKLKAKWADPEYRAAMIAKKKEQWKNPEYREMIMASQKAARERKRLTKQTSSTVEIQSDETVPLQKLLEHLEQDETPEVQQVITKSYRFGDHQ